MGPHMFPTEGGIFDPTVLIFEAVPGFLKFFFWFFLVSSGFFLFLVLKTTLKSTKPLLELDRTSSGTQLSSQFDPRIKDGSNGTPVVLLDGCESYMRL